MIESNKRAFTWSALSTLWAGGGFVGSPSKLCPVAMNGLRPSLEERIRHIIEESRVRVEIGDVDKFELYPFALEVIVKELNDGLFCQVGGVNVLKVGEDLLRGLASRLVDNGLLVRIRICQVERLQQLCVKINPSGRKEVIY